MTKAFTRRRLEWLLRARGTDLAAWPAADREAAITLMRRCPEAREAFAAAVATEGTEPSCPEQDAPVVERMQEALRRSLAPLPLLWRGLRAGALLACIAAGLYVGMFQAEADNLADPFAAFQTISLASLDP